MGVFNKFIIIDDEEGKALIIAKCTYHKQLAHDTNTIKGGGMWYYIDDNKTIVLHGESYDFGPAKLSDIKECIENNNVYTSYTKHNNISDKFEFKYQNVYKELIKLK